MFPPAQTAGQVIKHQIHGEGRGRLKAACAERCNNPLDYFPGELQENLLPWKGIIPALLPANFFSFSPKRKEAFH